jgi:hypothetical protein
MQYISIDWHPETSAFVLNATVNATRSPKKATDWSGIKKANLLKEIQPTFLVSVDR